MIPFNSFFRRIWSLKSPDFAIYNGGLFLKIALILSMMLVLGLSVMPIDKMVAFTLASPPEPLFINVQKVCGIPAPGVRSFVLSPNFTNDGSIYVTTGRSAIYRCTRNPDGNWTRSKNLWKYPDSPSPMYDVRMLALSPDFANDQTILAATASYIYKSADSGNSWAIIPAGASWGANFVSAAVSPNYITDFTLFAGTWCDGMLQDTWDTLYKSTNGGNFWYPSKVFYNACSMENPAGIGFTSIAISPNYAVDKTVFAGVWDEEGGNHGVYRTVDGGGSWSRLLGLAEGDPSVLDIALSLNYATDCTVFAGGSTENIFRSTDCGTTWTHYFANDSTGMPINAIELSPSYSSDSNVLICTTAADSNKYGLRQSLDGGITWSGAAFEGGACMDVYFHPDYPTCPVVFAGDSTGIYQLEAPGGIDNDEDGEVDCIDLDDDNDGLPDNWEVQYGLNPYDPTGDNGAAGDPDGDGFTNLQEYYGRSNPQDADSFPPDLIISGLSTTTAALTPGASLSLSNAVKNQGGSSAGTFNITFRLSSDALYGGTDDIAFSTTRSVSSLGVGASSSASTSVTVPSTTPLGNYYICSKADSGGTVNESNETNNTRCTTSTINVTRPDLIMTAVTPGTSTVNAGATLSVSNTAKNQGGLSAGSFTIAFRLSKNTTYGDSDDVTISTTRSVSSLGVGASSTATTSLTIPSTTKAGSYYVCAKADSGGTVTESNENNNTLCSSTQVTVPKPDLIMTALSTTTTAIKPGSSLSLSNTVKNQGGSSAGSSVIAFHLSSDAVYGGTDDIAFTTTRSVSSLGVGASSNASTSVTVSSTTPLGIYYICSKGDSGGTVSESNETNNTRCTTSTINVTKPDLVMTAVTPGATTVNAGAALSVTNTVKNQGGISAGSFTIAFRLSKNTTYGDADDVAISATRSVSSLAAGASSTATTSLTIPSTTKAGSYYVCAKADSGSTVAESNENNNILCSTTQVTVPSPDLIMSALSTAATSVARGGSFSLSNTAKNQGGSSAGSFAIAFHLSADAVYGGTDDRAFSTTRSVSSLSVGASSSASTSLTVSSTTPMGSYYVCAKADSGNTVNEGTNEGNNTRCTTTMINVQ